MFLRMRSSLVVRACDCQCTSCNGPGFDSSIRRHSGIRGAADEAVLNIQQYEIKNPSKKILKEKNIFLLEAYTIKGTVSRYFLLLVFFMNQFPPKPLSIPLGPFRIFSKIRGDIRSARLTTGVNDTGGKIAAGINDTGGKFATGINDTGGKFCHQFHQCW